MVYNIETRKVQQTGGSSFIVSLPKPWIVKYGIEKNDSVGIISQPDGNLLITPKIDSEDVLKSKEIIADEYKDYNFLFRVLIGAYIMGYSRITIKSSKKFDPAIRDCIMSFKQIAIGPEIIEETNNYIVMKDLLNPKELPFASSIKRMYILVEGMHNDAINALKKKDKEMAEDVIKRDNEVDRQHWLVARQSNIILKDIILSQKMGIKFEDANHFQSMSRFLERIGDHAVKIAKNVIKIIDKKIDDEIIEKIANISALSLELLNMSLEAWLQKDISIANDNIEAIAKLTDDCEKINTDGDHIDVGAYIAISYIVESIRRTGEYSTDISEIIINSLV